MKRPQARANRQIDNERVVVTEWVFESGAETGWHRHAYDYLVVPGFTGKLLLETRSGNNEAELAAGQSYYRNAGVEHNVVNINDATVSFVEVEFK